MTKSLTDQRTARQTAAAVRDLLRALMALSVEQMDAVEREDYEAANSMADRKEAYLQLLPTGIERLQQCGWYLKDASTWPTDGPCAPLVREAGDLARRLQAHERYVIGQMVARKRRIADRLDVILKKRHAAAGYQVPSERGQAIDWTR
jgi:BMFP domain-containing protein YqiC